MSLWWILLVFLVAFAAFMVWAIYNRPPCPCGCDKLRHEERMRRRVDRRNKKAR